MDHQLVDIEPLLERARRCNLVRYNGATGDAITLQIGRVVYSMERRRAIAFLEDALRKEDARKEQAASIDREQAYIRAERTHEELMSASRNAPSSSSDV